MRTDFALDVATAPRVDSKTWTQGNVSWGEFIGWMENPASEKQCGNYLFGRLEGTQRLATTIVSRSAVTLDVDEPQEDFLARLKAVVTGASLIHTTYSSTEDNPRYRVIIPADRSMSPDEYRAVCMTLMERVGTDDFDPGSSQAERFMFKPAASSPDLFWYQVNDGAPLPVDEYLVDDVAIGALDKPNTVHPNKRDPLTLPGVVGAFNRVYDFQTAIDVFDLPYDAVGDSWKYRGTKASTPPGLRLLSNPNLVQSHHLSDPAHDQTCSAFDLVRIHLYGPLDENCKSGTPVNRRPSHNAMIERADQDPDVHLEAATADFDAIVGGLGMDDSDDDDDTWMLQVTRSAQSRKMHDVQDNWDLITKHYPIFKSIRFNLLTMGIETTAERLPWDDKPRYTRQFGLRDHIELVYQLERDFKFRPSKTQVEQLVISCAHNNRYNPVAEYLEGLTWDGTPRVETCLPTGVRNDYTRLVARKVMCGAVARALDPGVKWDHMLVLQGAEGLGKTRWIENMAHGWRAPLGPIHLKDTLIEMHRSWIVISDEGHSLRKADAEAQKEFLTRTADVFRMPYDREAAMFDRRFVIWSTTNEGVFLRRQEGNRRFLVINVEARVDEKKLTAEYRDQVWAEAVQMYLAGESLFLTPEENDLAAVVREDATEENMHVGDIQNYMDTLVPENWDDLSTPERLEWMYNSQRGGLVAPGTHPINMVCSTQIWREVLGGDQSQSLANKAIGREISAALDLVPGWTRVSHRNCPPYGKQRVWVRDVPRVAGASDFDTITPDEDYGDLL